MSKALVSVILPSCRAVCAAARSPSTQSLNSATSAICLAPTRLGYLLDSARPCRSRHTVDSDLDGCIGTLACVDPVRTQAGDGVGAPATHLRRPADSILFLPRRRVCARQPRRLLRLRA